MMLTVPFWPVFGTLSGMKEKLLHILCDQLPIKFASVRDDSHLHAGHAQNTGRENTHFAIQVVSDHFEGHNQVQRHRLIYGLYKQWMNNPIHAVQIHAYTSAEWANLQEDTHG